MAAPLLRPFAALGLALAGIAPLACVTAPPQDHSSSWMEAVLVFDG
jgi:hypothetical protein